MRVEIRVFEQRWPSKIDLGKNGELVRICTTHHILSKMDYHFTENTNVRR